VLILGEGEAKKRENYSMKKNNQQRNYPSS